MGLVLMALSCSQIIFSAMTIIPRFRPSRERSKIQSVTRARRLKPFCRCILVPAHLRPKKRYLIYIALPESVVFLGLPYARLFSLSAVAPLTSVRSLHGTARSQKHAGRFQL